MKRFSDMKLTQLQTDGVCWFWGKSITLAEVCEGVSTLGLELDEIELTAAGTMVGLRVIQKGKKSASKICTCGVKTMQSEYHSFTCPIGMPPS